ncbi:MAG TPA: hypothetical protein VLJ59_02780 [Mycobacteriales bacterium]|nr:hypothetical protein [Mycobacteriales bacterium]
MLIDCEGCAVREVACGDCVVTGLLGSVPRSAELGGVGLGGVELDDTERHALAVLVESGLVPPLRLVTETKLSGNPSEKRLADALPLRPDVGQATRRRRRHAAG